MEDHEGFDGLKAAKSDFRFGTQQYRQVEKGAVDVIGGQRVDGTETEADVTG